MSLHPYPDAETRRAFMDSVVEDQRPAARSAMQWTQRRLDAYMSEQNLELVKKLHDILDYTDDDSVVKRVQALIDERMACMNMGDLCRLDGWKNSTIPG